MGNRGKMRLDPLQFPQDIEVQAAGLGCLLPFLQLGVLRLNGRAPEVPEPSFSSTSRTAASTSSAMQTVAAAS